MTKLPRNYLGKIHILLKELDLNKYKGLLVMQFTNNRTEHSSEMKVSEALQLITHLSKLDGAAERMRRKVFALAYEVGLIWGDTPDDKRMNGAKLDKFLRERGTVKKPLNAMSKEELQKTVSQLQQMVKHNASSQAGKAVKSLLNELNMPVEGRSRK